MSEFVDRLSITDESGNIKKEININFGDPLAREQSQKAMQTSQQAKQTANEAKQIAQEAKDAVPGQVSQQVEEATQELSGQIGEAKQTANEAKQIAQKVDVIANMSNGGYTTNENVNKYMLGATFRKYPTGLIDAPDVEFTLDGNRDKGYYLGFVNNDGEYITVEVKNGYNVLELESPVGAQVYLYLILDNSLYTHGESVYSASFNNEKFKFTKKVNSINISSSYEERARYEQMFNSAATDGITKALIKFMLEGIKSKCIAIEVPQYATASVYPTLNASIVPDVDNLVARAVSYNYTIKGNKQVVGVVYYDCSDKTDMREMFGAGSATTNKFTRYRFLTHIKGITNYTPALNNEGAKLMFYDMRRLEVVEFVSGPDDEDDLTELDMTSMFADTMSLRSVTLPSNISDAYMDFMFANSGIKNLSFGDSDQGIFVFSMRGIVHGAKNLERLDMNNLNVSTVSEIGTLADNSHSLRFFSGLVDVRVSYSLAPHAYLTHESALNCIYGLYDLTEGGTEPEYTAQTLTFHPDVTAQLTEEEIAEATAKGWNIA